MDSLGATVQLDIFFIQFFLHVLEPFSVVVYVLYYGVGFPYEGYSRLYNQSLLPWRSFPQQANDSKPKPNPCAALVSTIGEFIYFNNAFHTALFVAIAVFYAKNKRSFNSNGVGPVEIIVFPLINFAAQKALIALKYAMLTQNEYERFMTAPPKVAHMWNLQLQLITGWLAPTDAMFDVELSLASRLTGADLYFDNYFEKT